MKTLAVIALLAATPLAAQSQCGPTEQMAETLLARYGETLIGQGIGQSGVMMQVFANPDTRTFTLAVSMPDATSCLIYAGTDFEAFHYVPNI